MALTRAETQVTWPTAADSKSVAAGADETSEEFNLDDTCVEAEIQLKADNSTSAASDDIIDFYLVQTLGDPDADPDSADEFDTAGHALFLARLDTSSEDPAIKTVPIPVVSKGAKVIANGSNAGTTNAITCSATIRELRSA